MYESCSVRGWLVDCMIFSEMGMSRDGKKEDGRGRKEKAL